MHNIGSAKRSAPKTRTPRRSPVNKPRTVRKPSPALYGSQPQRSVTTNTSVTAQVKKYIPHIQPLTSSQFHTRVAPAASLSSHIAQPSSLFNPHALQSTLHNASMLFSTFRSRRRAILSPHSTSYAAIHSLTGIDPSSILGAAYNDQNEKISKKKRADTNNSGAGGGGSDGSNPSDNNNDSDDDKKQDKDKSPSKKPKDKEADDSTDKKGKLGNIFDISPAEIRRLSRPQSSGKSGKSSVTANSSNDKKKKQKKGDKSDDDDDDDDDNEVDASGKKKKNKDDQDEPDEDDEKKQRWSKVLNGITGFSSLSLLWFTLLNGFSSNRRLSSALNHSYEHFRDTFLANGHVKRLDIRDNLIGAHVQASHGVNGELQPPIQGNAPIEDVYYFSTLDIGVFGRQLHNDLLRFGFTDLPIYHPVQWNADAFISSLLIILSVWLIARTALMGPGKSILSDLDIEKKMGAGAKKWTIVKNIDTRFKDVAGMDEAKAEIVEFVDFLKNPDKYHQVGARLPKGALLHGPPGTGKTLLAKAIAGEAGCPFINVSGSDFIQMYVGLGSKRVRELFAQARKRAPCIIFIDEIDAIARRRDSQGSHEEREATLNQLLVEMDGFKNNEKIVVLCATNRKDILDPAFTRAGRIDRKIVVDAPDLRGRTDILKVHLNKITTDYDRDELSAKLAALTPGMVGADLANICNEAAIVAAREDKSSVELVDFEKAVDRTIGGLEKKSLLNKQQLDRKIVAYHESGHAVAGWFLEHADPLLKVTIVPRTSGALGFAQYLPKETGLKQIPELLDRMCVTLAGRAAEDIFFGKISTGASDDLKKVTDLARSMITTYGMSPKLPNMAYPEDDNGMRKPMADATSEIIDDEVTQMVREQYQRVRDLLIKHKDPLEKLSLTLLDKETINHDTLIEVLGPRPFQDDAYLHYLEQHRLRILTEREKELLQEDKDNTTTEEKK